MNDELLKRLQRAEKELGILAAHEHSEATSMELDDLADVAAPSAGSGDLLQFNGTNWINADLVSLVATPYRDTYAVLAPASTPHFDLTTTVAAGGLSVYYNGVRVLDADFTLDSDNNGFTLAFDVAAGDYIIAEQFNLSSGVTFPFTKTYSSDTMDGIFTHLGTNAGTANFVNPALGSVRPGHAAYYIATQINDLDVTSPARKATDNSIEQYGGCSHTQSVSSAWWKADFGTGHTVTPTYVGVIGRTGGGAHLRNWKVQGSNDDAAWTDLLTVSGAGPDDSTWYSAAISGASAYRYLRILQTGVNSSGNEYLTIGELEFWGTMA